MIIQKCDPHFGQVEPSQWAAKTHLLGEHLNKFTHLFLPAQERGEGSAVYHIAITHSELFWGNTQPLAGNCEQGPVCGAR